MMRTTPTAEEIAVLLPILSVIVAVAWYEGASMVTIGLTGAASFVSFVVAWRLFGRLLGVDPVWRT